MHATAPGERRTTHRFRNALVVFAVWTGIGLFFFTQGLVQARLRNDDSPAWHVLAAWLVGVWIAALATPLILALGRRFPLERRRWLAPALAHFAFSIAIAIAQLVAQSLVLPALRVYPQMMKDPPSTFVLLFVLGFHQAVLTYWEILALQTGWNVYQRFQERRREAARLELRAAELQSELARAQLGALKAQLQPHFLFNTLNAIVTLVRQQQGARAEVMLGRLADLLRCVLEDSLSQEVPLQRELEYARLYLSIEEMRFGDRLHVEWHEEPGLSDARVPHLCLQPILENAIRHGIGRRAVAGRLVIRVRREGESVVLSVEDDGPGLETGDGSRPGGIGLVNTRARLARLYGDAGRLELGAAEPHGVVATLRLPYRLEDDVHGEEASYAVQLPDRG